jgi:hypothetical protein
MKRHPHGYSSLISPSNPKPYCTVGAGQLTSFIWKSGDAVRGWRYRFNLFRLTSRGGRVSQMFGPPDIMHFVKLLQVLASVLADDGCLNTVERGVLKRLATDLDGLLRNAAIRKTHEGETDGNTARS